LCFLIPAPLDIPRDELHGSVLREADASLGGRAASRATDARKRRGAAGASGDCPRRSSFGRPEHCAEGCGAPRRSARTYRQQQPATVSLVAVNDQTSQRSASAITARTTATTSPQSALSRPNSYRCTGALYFVVGVTPPHPTDGAGNFSFKYCLSNGEDHLAPSSRPTRALYRFCTPLT
jgi:hypothetical protein